MSHCKTASCFCGAIEVEVQGDPLVQGFCHCTSCRAWTGQPVLAYALWPDVAVHLRRGADSLGAMPRTEDLTVHFCTSCGGNIMAASASGGVVDVFPMIIKGFAFAPECHVNYAERAIDMPDGLPKFRDMPERAGGTGALMSE